MNRLVALVLAFVVLTLPLGLNAQTAPSGTSALMLSWRSNGFAPAGFAGRVAASGGGTVLVLAEVIVNGSPASLSPYEVRWFVNENLYQSGFGIQSITIPVNALLRPNEFDVRVEVVGAPFAATEGTLTVPLTNPMAVIEDPQRGGLYTGANIYTAGVYAFNTTNADNLNYAWTINGEVPQASDDPRHLRIDVEGVPSQTVLNLSVAHPDNAEEAASKSLVLVPVQ